MKTDPNRLLTNGLTIHEHIVIQLATGLCTDPEFCGSISLAAIKIADEIIGDLNELPKGEP